MPVSRLQARTQWFSAIGAARRHVVNVTKGRYSEQRITPNNVISVLA